MQKLKPSDIRCGILHDNAQLLHRKRFGVVHIIGDKKGKMFVFWGKTWLVMVLFG